MLTAEITTIMSEPLLSFMVKLSGYDSATDAITKGFTEYLGIDGKKDRVQFNYNYSLLEKPINQEIS